MNRADALPIPQAGSGAHYLEDTSPQRVVLNLYDREAAALRRYAGFLGLDSHSAEEVVQEAFLKLHRHLLDSGDTENLRAWLYRVAHNLARNMQTSARATKTESMPPSTVAQDYRSAAASAEEELLADERDRRVRSAMESLTCAQRQAVVLRARGLKYREIAEVLNLSVSAVGENIQRALVKLRELV